MSGTRIVVLSGGYSSERDVSLRSGEAVAQALLARGHAVRRLDLMDVLPGGSLAPEAWMPGTDVVMLALHGSGGEDGLVQGMLELAGMPYTGSGVLASATAMDKGATKRVYRAAGLPVAADLLVPARDVRDADSALLVPKVEHELGWPVVLKAVCQGSTHGIEVVRGPADWARAWAFVAGYGEDVLVEAFVRGREFTVPVWGHPEPEALPIVEIVPTIADYFTLEAKYQPGGADEIVPAVIAPELAAMLADLGVRAHRALGCFAVSRTDVLLAADGRPFLLETNTVPGMTEGSLLPKALAAAGVKLGVFAEHMVQWALERGTRRRVSR